VLRQHHGLVSPRHAARAFAAQTLKREQPMSFVGVPLLVLGLVGIGTNWICVIARTSVVPIIPSMLCWCGACWAPEPGWRIALVAAALDPANWMFVVDIIRDVFDRGSGHLAPARLVDRQRSRRDTNR
jgi:hypothetical protein